MGSVGSGGLAEKGAYFEQQIMPLPESMDFETAAAFPLNYGHHHALKQRGELKRDKLFGAWRRGGLELQQFMLQKQWELKLQLLLQKISLSL